MKALDVISEIGWQSVERILAETGVKMEYFQDKSLKATLVKCAYKNLLYFKRKNTYHDLGLDDYMVINQKKLIKRNLYSLEKLGITVIVQPGQ